MGEVADRKLVKNIEKALNLLNEATLFIAWGNAENAYWALREARDALDEAIDRLSGMLRREA